MSPFLVPVIIFGALLLLWLLKRALSPGGGRGGIRSVAIMRRTPLELSEPRVKTLVERALGDRPEITFVPIPPRDDGAQMHAFIRDGRVFGVISVPRPYAGPDAHESIRKIVADPEIVTAMTESSAWVSVDFMRGDRDLGVINETICRVIAELIDDEAMLLYDVRHERISKIDARAREILRGPAPMLVFGQEEATVSARAGDEALKAAQDEAQRQWPEFVAGWNDRHPEAKCAVKAPFRDGKHVEHMWVEVLAIDDDSVSGEINNDPQRVRNVRIGQYVTVPLQEVEDWIIAEPSGKLRGGFSVNTLMGKQMG